MATNVIEIEAPPETVFDVLTDPGEYARWVVGAKRIRDADDTWPQPGARFHHAVGTGPAEIKDSTKIVEIDPPRRLVLEARFRPPGVASIELDLEPVGDRTTRLTMHERLLNGGILATVADPLIWLRNQWSLSRLKRIVEARARRR